MPILLLGLKMTIPGHLVNRSLKIPTLIMLQPPLPPPNIKDVVIAKQEAGLATLIRRKTAGYIKMMRGRNNRKNNRKSSLTPLERQQVLVNLAGIAK